jgi:biotin operon repressor
MGDNGSHGRPSERRAAVARLIDSGYSQAEVGRKLGLSKATVSYHARRLGIPADDRASRRYDWAEVQRAYDAGLSVRECARQFGFCLESWSAAVKRGAVTPRPRAMPIETLLVPDRQQTNRSHLKQRLLDAGFKENRCERCGLTEWQGEPLTMSLHHLNGRGKDNRLENIQFLCPNCHAQTDNWGGRGVKRNGSRAE